MLLRAEFKHSILFRNHEPLYLHFGIVITFPSVCMLLSTHSPIKDFAIKAYQTMSK